MNIEDFWAKSYFATTEIKVEKLGNITIKELSALDLQDMLKVKGELSQATFTVIRSVVDEDGKRKFKDSELSKLMNKLPAGVISEISIAIVNLSGMGTDPKPKKD